MLPRNTLHGHMQPRQALLCSVPVCIARVYCAAVCIAVCCVLWWSRWMEPFMPFQFRAVPPPAAAPNCNCRPKKKRDHGSTDSFMVSVIGRHIACCCEHPHPHPHPHPPIPPTPQHPLPPNHKPNTHHPLPATALGISNIAAAHGASVDGRQSWHRRRSTAAIAQPAPNMIPPITTPL